MIQQFTTFDCFPRLPLELRIVIWGFALPGPRLLRVTAPESCYERLQAETLRHWDPSKFIIHITIKFKLEFETSDNDIGMLRACWESRQVVLDAYPLCLPSAGGASEIRACPDDKIAVYWLQHLFTDLYSVRNNDMMLKRPSLTIGAGKASRLCHPIIHQRNSQSCLVRKQ